MSSLEKVSWSNLTVEKAAELLAEQAVFSRYTKKMQKQAAPAFVASIKDTLKSNPTLALGLGGAGLGGLTGLVTNQFQDEDKTKSRRDIVTGAIAGGAMGTGLGLLKSNLPKKPSKDTSGGLPFGYFTEGGSVNRIKPEVLAENPELANEIYRLHDKSLLGRGLGATKSFFGNFVGNHPIASTVLGADLASNTVGTLASQLPTSRTTLNPIVWKRGLNKYLAEGSQTLKDLDSQPELLKQLRTINSTWTPSQIRERILNQARRGKDIILDNTKQLALEYPNVLPTKEVFPENFPDEVKALLRKQGLTPAQLKRIQGAGTPQDIIDLVDNIIKERPLGKSKDLRDLITSYAKEVPNPEYEKLVSKATLPKELVNRVSSSGGIRHATPSSIYDIINFLKAPFGGKNTTPAFATTGYNAAGEARGGTINKILRFLESGAEMPAGLSNKARIGGRLGAYVGLPIAAELMRYNAKDNANAAKIEKLKQMLSERVSSGNA